MELPKSNLTLEMSENVRTMDFSIDEQNIGLILETLRSKMYSDPIGAVCREVASNSRDANREVGNLSPTQIIFNNNSIWTENKPVVIFKDNGPGISPQRIADVFVKFGASTKRHTNKFTGGFGYGAKTPFAYTDTFYIKTVVDKSEYVYICALDESRRGKLILLTERVTDESNGTEIIIPLQKQDIDNFKNKVLFYTYYWDVRPTYVGIDESKQKQYDIDIAENNSKYLVGECKAFPGIYALIDGIPYLLSNKNFNQNVSSYNYQDTCFLKFENGDLAISTNREFVIVDDPTNKILSDFISTMLNEINNKMIKRFDELYNSNRMIELLIEVQKFNKTSKILELFDYFKHKFAYKKFDIKKLNELWDVNTTFTTVGQTYGKNKYYNHDGFFDYLDDHVRDIDKVKFYIKDMASPSSRVKTLQATNEKFVIVSIPTYFRNIEASEQFGIFDKSNEKEYNDSETKLSGNFTQFLKDLEHQKRKKEAFKMLCEFFKPQNLSTVKNANSRPRLPKEQRIKAPENHYFESVFVSANAQGKFAKDNYKIVDGKLIDKVYNQDYKGLIFPIYADTINDWNYSTKQLQWFNPFKKDVLFVRIKSNKLKKALQKNYTLIENNFDISQITGTNFYHSIVYDLRGSSCDKTHKTNINSLSHLWEFNKLFTIFDDKEKSIVETYKVNFTHSMSSLGRHNKQFKEFYEKCIKEHIPQLEQNALAVQCIIVKYDPLFSFELGFLRTRLNDKMKKAIKDILHV